MQRGPTPSIFQGGGLNLKKRSLHLHKAYYSIKEILDAYSQILVAGEN